MRSRRSLRGPVSLGLAAATSVVVTAFVGVFALHRVVPVPELKDVDIGGEADLPTWWNAALLLTAALTAALAGAVDAERARRRAWLLVALTATCLSLDEAASVHERLAAPVRGAGIDVPTHAWLVPGVLLAVGGTVVLGLGTRPRRRDGGAAGGGALPARTARRGAVAPSPICCAWFAQRPRRRCSPARTAGHSPSRTE